MILTRIVTVAALCFLLNPTVSAQETWKAGVAKANITPPQPMWMSGYASRSKPAEGKSHDLWAKAIVLEDPAGKRVILVTLDLVGIAHLAYVPSANDGTRSAEFGVSVLHDDRHRGLGAALLARAAVHARNTHIDTLFVHCLAKNKAMMHLAHKLGMRVEFAYGDADAYLILPPANAQSILHEASQEHMADLDYALKANLKQSKQIWRWFYGMQSQP